MTDRPVTGGGPDDPRTPQPENPLTGRRGARVAQALPDWLDGHPAESAVPAEAGAAVGSRAAVPVPVVAVPGGEGLADDASGAPVDPADADLLDDGWNAPRRTSRWTAAMVAGLVGVAGFAGGAYLQRSHDQGLIPTVSAAGSGAASRAFGAGAGFGGAGTGGGAGFGGAAAGTGTAGAGTTGGTAAAAAPVVVGTVFAVQGTTLTVKNFGGAAIAVHVAGTTSVTSVGLGGLEVGATVAVFGTKAADGSVTATSVVSRRAG